MNAGHRHFRNRSARAQFDSHYGPNMTPMVDVVMVILIFFMASAAILGPEWFLKSTLPVMAGSASNTTPPRRVVIELAGTDITIRVDQAQPLTATRETLATNLRAIAQSPGAECIALIKPSAVTPYDLVVAAHEACAQAGLTRSGVAPPDAAAAENKAPISPS